VPKYSSWNPERWARDDGLDQFRRDIERAKQEGMTIEEMERRRQRKEDARLGLLSQFEYHEHEA